MKKIGHECVFVRKEKTGGFPDRNIFSYPEKEICSVIQAEANVNARKGIYNSIERAKKLNLTLMF